MPRAVVWLQVVTLWTAPERTTPVTSGTGLTIYSTTWCGYCSRLKSQLDRAGVSYDAVDIEEQPGAEEFVKSVNGGNAVVPTVVFADGTALTNPSIVDVQAKLAA